MWSSLISHPINFNAHYDISFNSTISAVEKETRDKQLKIEKKLCLESDTDFQSFLLPLEQDFTKSSKGYASMLDIIPKKKVKSENCKNKLKESKINMSSSENYFDNNLKNTDKLLHSTSSDISSPDSTTNNADSFYHKNCTQFIHGTLENMQVNQIGGNVFYKGCTKIAHNSSQNSYDSGNVSEKKELNLEEQVKINCDFLINLSSSDGFSEESNEESEDTSESSDTDNFDESCNNSINFDDESSSDDSVIFSEEFVQNKNWYSAPGIKENDDDYEYHKVSEGSISAIFSSDFTFEFDAINCLKKPVTAQTNLCDPMMTFKSEGYINPCFEDFDYSVKNSSILQRINKSWNDSMKDISEEPREPKVVSFVPLPDLVSVFSYEPEDDDYCYSLYILDQLRFQSRIKDFELIIAPYLTSEHRANIYRRNYSED